MDKTGKTLVIGGIIVVLGSFLFIVWKPYLFFQSIAIMIIGLYLMVKASKEFREIDRIAYRSK